MNRRNFVTGVLATSAIAGNAIASDLKDNNLTLAATQSKEKFNFENVIDEAKQLAKSSYKDNKLKLIEPFTDLNYDQYRGIRFKRSFDPLRKNDSNTLFGLDLLPPGYYYQDRVEIFLVKNGEAKDIKFRSSMFDFDNKLFIRDNLNISSDEQPNLSFSGFRLRFPINFQDVDDEFIVFQGASYFRAIARNTLYGLSARGLSIKTSEPEGEEFPRFSKFWIYQPQDNTSISIDALLDSESTTGAFHFEILPANETIINVRSVLFPRKDIAKYGIAPLTSMYYFSPTRKNRVDDYRNAVCDSNMLTIHTGNSARLCRPLNNPNILQYSAFMDKNPKSFGLIQRNRNFVDFQDLEARYENRPSACVYPVGDWDRGSVSLVEIPTDSEFNDNIIAFWQGAAPLKAGEKYNFNYRLTWSQSGDLFISRAKVNSSRIGRSVNNRDNFSIIIDYEFNELAKNIEEIHFTATANRGEILAPHFNLIPNTNIIRAAFEYKPNKNENAELQASLSNNEQAISETWLYRWTW